MMHERPGMQDGIGHMLREHNKLMVKAHKVLDVVLTAAAFICAYLVKKYILPEPFRGLIAEPDYSIVLLLIIIVWYMVFDAFQLYASYRRQTYSHLFFGMVRAVSVAMPVLLLLMFVLKISDVSRILLGLFYIFDILLLGLSKWLVFQILTDIRSRGYNYRHVLVVGRRNRIGEVTRMIRDGKGAGFRVIGCVTTDNGDDPCPAENGCRVLGPMDRLAEIMEREVIDELLFAMALHEIDAMHPYIGLARERGIAVRIIPDWHIQTLRERHGRIHIRFGDFLRIPTMSLETTPPDKTALLIKTLLDYIAAGALVLLTLPLMAVIGVAIKIASPGGPVLYKQERCGLNGRRFQVYKFRTMLPDADLQISQLVHQNEADGPVFKIRNDPRIIPHVGHFLRKTSIDELPQFFNVLRGEMSLIGPRPPIPEEVAQYQSWQRRRLSMKPGLTCIWQIMPNRNDVRFDDWMRMDLEYIDNWSLLLDAKLFFRTIWVMLNGTGR